MASYVDVSDRDAAIAAAQTIAALAETLGSGGEPPEADWGNDELGLSMKSRYLTAPIGRCVQQRAELAERLREVADNVHKALAELEAEEHANIRMIRMIRPLDE